MELDSPTYAKASVGRLPEFTPQFMRGRNDRHEHFHPLFTMSAILRSAQDDIPPALLF
ncbi:MAG: hypothetical protein ABSF32_03280 [Ignavibacteria bacterium]